jgi:catechol 2,3-dioxygenase-like lactoylglutathione lyase family enzyme
MIKRIHHAGVGVRDMEASLRFYRDLLGLTVTSDVETEGPLVSAIVGHTENTKVRMVHLACGEGQELELFQYMEPGTSKFPQDFRQCDGGIIHVALVVDDAMGMYERLKAEGVRFNSQPYNLGGGYCVYMRDPDGITVELMQFDVDD